MALLSFPLRHPGDKDVSMTPQVVPPLSGRQELLLQAAVLSGITAAPAPGPGIWSPSPGQNTPC